MSKGSAIKKIILQDRKILGQDFKASYKMCKICMAKSNSYGEVIKSVGVMAPMGKLPMKSDTTIMKIS